MLWLFTVIASSFMQKLVESSFTILGIIFQTAKDCNILCYCVQVQSISVLIASFRQLLGSQTGHRFGNPSPLTNSTIPTTLYLKLTQTVSRQFHTISIATRVDCGTCCRRLRFVITMLWSCISLDVTVDEDEGQIVQLQTETQTAANHVFLTQPGFSFFNGSPGLVFKAIFSPLWFRQATITR